MIYAVSESEIVKRYELLLIFRPDISEDERVRALKELKEQIQAHTKGVFFEDSWGLRRFAFRIKKYDDGYYTVLYFEGPTSAVFEIRQSVKLHPTVLRHLLIILPEKYDVKSLHDIELMQPARVEKKEKSRRPTVEKHGLKQVVQEIMEGTPEEKLLQGKTEEEKLKAVDKTLESILENPDINIS